MYGGANCKPTTQGGGPNPRARNADGSVCVPITDADRSVHVQHRCWQIYVCRAQICVCPSLMLTDLRVSREKIPIREEDIRVPHWPAHLKGDIPGYTRPASPEPGEVAWDKPDSEELEELSAD